MNYLIEHKELILGALYALMNIINMLTKHPTGGGPGIKSFLMWFIEVGSVLQSKDAPGWVKLPVTSKPPVLPPKVEEVHPPTPVGESNGSP